jgi:GT2 family glycosyltransferase
MGGIVTADICRDLCPHVDHATDESECLNSPTVDQAQSLGGQIPVALDPALVSIAMVTAPRPISTVERSIAELRRAGFCQPIRLFAEPRSPSVDLAGVMTHFNDRTLGAWHNWLQAAHEMAGEGDSPFILLCEDDIELASCAALALQYAITRLPYDDWGFASLYSPEYNLREHRTDKSGWWPVTRTSHWGALAWCFSRQSLRAILTSKIAARHGGDRDADVVVSQALHAAKRQTYFHLPSLAAHTGFGISSLGHIPRDQSAAVHFNRNYEGYVAASPSCSVSRAEADASAVRRVRVVGDQSVAVIIPNFNCEAYLKPCIESIRNQSVDCEIVVVDDGSTDASIDRLQQYDPKIRVLRHAHNQGAHAARVTGIRATRSEWVVMADADAVYDRDYLKCLLDATAGDTSVSYCAMRRKIVSTGQQQVIGGGRFDPQELWWNNFISMCSLVRRSALPLDLMPCWNHLDDWQLWLHLACEGHRFVGTNKVLFDALVRPDGKSAQVETQAHRGAVEVASVRRSYAELIGCTDPVSVVIPATNSADLTSTCLWHLARYTGLPLTFIYVDNGSRSGTIGKVQESADILQIPLQIIRNSTNPGFTAAVNQGIARSRGRHVLCQNNDCFVGPQCVDRMFAELTQAPQIAAVGPLTGDDSRHSLRQRWLCAEASVSPDYGFDYDDAVTGARVVRGRRRGREDRLLAFFCTLMHREAIAECGLLDQATPEFRSGLGADDEWCHRVTTRGWRLRMAMDAYAVHLGNQTFKRLGIDRNGLQKAALRRLSVTD